MRQGVPDNSIHVCDELTLSRTLRENSTERNKKDLILQLNDIFITNQCYSFKGSRYCTNETHAAATAQK